MLFGNSVLFAFAVSALSTFTGIIVEDREVFFTGLAGVAISLAVIVAILIEPRGWGYILCFLSFMTPFVLIIRAVPGVWGLFGAIFFSSVALFLVRDLLPDRLKKDV